MKILSLTAGLLLALSSPARASVALSFDLAPQSNPAPASLNQLAARPATPAIALSFDPHPAENLPPAAPTPIPVASAAPVAPPPPLAASPVAPPTYDLDQLFTGGSDSLVAHAVGHAEGTRTAAGGYTRYYNGHTDPGNGVWNLGTFSYQHGASSAAEADTKQLQRLRSQATELRQQAATAGITLTLLEELNGIDLANQAPVTALDRGYIKWLERAKRTSMSEPERIVWARTRSFIHPDTGRWNAPGLGNTLPSVTRDQRRRQQAISQVLIQSPRRP